MSVQIQQDVRDGLRCAVCEQLFGTDSPPRFYYAEQGVMIHNACWST